MPEGTWTAQTWTVLPVPLILNRTDGTAMGGTSLQGGYHVQSVSRWCLPDEDRAAFYIDFGLINSVSVVPLDLHNTAIRIQVVDDDTFPTGATELPTSSWKTVFVGTVIYSTTTAQPGSFAIGRRMYYCAGALWRTRMWPLDRHSTAAAPQAKGHPGYNIPLHNVFRKVLGNQGPTTAADPYGDLTGPPDISAYYKTHRLPIDGQGAPELKWTDEEAIQHALVASRASGEALFQVDLSAGLFTGTYAWQSHPGKSCWDLLREICNRQRGRGSVFLDYSESTPLGDVTLTLKAYASNVLPMTYKTALTPGVLTLSKTNTIPAASTGGTDPSAIDVDIYGDHRLTDAGFQYDDRQSSVYDMVTVQGECIQVVCNLNFFGSSLAARWSAADQTAFNALPVAAVQQRSSARWKHVYRRYGIPDAYNYNVTAEPGGTSYAIAYYCDNLGGVYLGSPTVSQELTSTMTFRVMSDLPIYEGWRYDTVPPQRYDNGTDYLPPGRKEPVIMYKADTNYTNGDRTWVPLVVAGFNIQTDDFGMLIVNSLEDPSGYRMMAPSTAASFANFTQHYANIPDVTLASGFDQNKFNTIVGVELGTRVQIARGAAEANNTLDYSTAGRRLTMTVNGLHLWLGAPGAIWELDFATAAQGNQKWNAGLKFPAGVPTVIRDDRDALSFIAALAFEYYGQIHNPGTWTLKDCGLLTSFAAFNGDNVKYPKLGQLVGSVTYSEDSDGEVSQVLNTPITSVHYDHDSGETSWRTDYVSYDGNAQ